ncbi:DUF3592 domain-containing protein [Haloarcula onubensis]|uniref:DUF3592 domain-containing protein n=1 Tax=Haloarcula onubensis TaxID=2950539 RepID=A0ABU2FMH9_9EURY|nr:DUF3592 domain-containing protein [Halomicroarcula sp. S3CR25-11]MDS0281948.1 DUF3592 domain-containing protein [Halomicroarcula sp. S3CR25-11]
MPSPPRAFGLIVGLTLLVSGGVLAAGQVYRLNEYESTTATMETARIETIAADAAYSPDVTYSYTVDGQRYYGENVAAGTGIVTGNREKLDAVLPPSAGTVTVYYNPGSPDDAYLLRRYNFFPGGVLLVFGLFVLTDTLTPNLRVVRFLSSLFPIDLLERMPGVEPRTVAHAPDDPTAILENRQTWTGQGRAPIRGGAVPAVWLLCYLLMADLTIAYFWFSGWPYDLWGVLTPFVVAAGVLRLGFARLLD